MITHLSIENLILIRKCNIALGPHLNILTGETGSGKSVILTALRLIAGERADLDTIGKWGDAAKIEARVGDHTIRREIHRSGKSQCFLDGHLTTLSFLKEWVGTNIEIVDQNSSHSLSSSDLQRKKLDLFAGSTLDASQLADSFQEQKKIEAERNELEKRKSDYEKDRVWAETNLSLIQEVNWKEGEEESLNQEHEKLSHAQELASSLEQIASQLSENPFLRQLAHQLQTNTRFDATLQPIAASLKNCSLELEEVERQLRSYLDRLEADPIRLSLIEARFAAIEPLKKRFGPTHADMEKKRLHFQNLLDSQSELDTHLSTLSTQLQELEQKNQLLAKLLSAKRQKGATQFSFAILKELKALNLPHAEFQILLEPKPLSATGSESVRFLFSANPGHPPLPLEECASGGEQSRLLFAIQATLAEKQKTGALIFDEIDSNIGGHTASIVGEKLKELSSHRQVICVTHFAQVAHFATDHFAVCKREATIEISHLTESEREREYSRMQGGGVKIEIYR